MTTDGRAFSMGLINASMAGRDEKWCGGLEKETKLKSRADVLPKWRGRVVVSSACVLERTYESCSCKSQTPC